MKLRKHSAERAKPGKIFGNIRVVSSQIVLRRVPPYNDIFFCVEVGKLCSFCQFLNQQTVLGKAEQVCPRLY